jgi:hypothetical protein
VSHSWEGNTSAPEIFQERAAALIATFQNSIVDPIVKAKIRSA